MTAKAWWAAPLAVALALGAMGVRPAASAEDPAAAAKPGSRWTLGFTHGHLKRAVVGESTYYYMAMTVTNATGLPRDWRPHVVGIADTRAAHYVAGGYAPVVKEIRRVEGDDALEPIETTGWVSGAEGKIKDGETKKVVAIFGPIDAQWGKFRIEVLGLINPVATLKVMKYDAKRWTVSDTAYAERNDQVLKSLRDEAAKAGASVPTPTPEYHVVVENRAWVMEFSRSGDEFRPDDDPINFVRERWEILGEPTVIRVIPSKV